MEQYSADESETLSAVLQAAPGVQLVKTVQRHHKGGYAVTLEVDKEALDELIEYLPANGLRSVW